MSEYYGDFAEDETLYIPFNTFDSNDPSASVTITNLADADIKVHKDGSATQIVTDGATIAIDFDSITGNHLITIDTSASADYSTGSDYMVRIEGTTVDAATINAWVGSFSIQNRYSAGALRPTTAGRTLDVTATGAAGIDWANVEGQSTAVDLSGTDIQLCDTITTYTSNTPQSADNNTILAKIPLSDGVITWNSTALASINAECDTAVADYDGPTRAEATSDKDEIITDLDDIKGTGFVKDTHSLIDIEAYVDILDDGTSGNAKIATDVAAVLVDTGTTLDTKINTIDTNVDSILVDTAEIGTAGAGLTDLGGMSTGMKAEVNTEADTALTDYAPATAASILTTALTESYAADGAAGTLTQLLYMTQQALTEFAIAGTTVTVKKLDGSTTAGTFTLDDGTSPTSKTRAT